MDGEAHVGALLAQELGDLVDRVLRLRHRHAVARHDDDALARRRSRSAVSSAPRSAVTSPAGCRRRRQPLPRLRAAPKPPKDHAQERAVHRAAHDVAEDRAARSDQRAGDDQQVVREHEARRRRRPSRVAVEHRHHDRHVGAADRHHQVDAEQPRDARSSPAAGHTSASKSLP